MKRSQAQNFKRLTSITALPRNTKTFTRSNHYDAIVVGVGAMGSTTVYNLAKRGHKVLGLEQYDIPHSWGSSHGHSRIIRLAYFEDPNYVYLMHRAYELWHEIERDANTKLLHTTGSIDAGPPDSQVFLGSKHSCELHKLDHEVLTSAQLSKRFPAFQLPSNIMTVLQPQGGYLNPEKCIVTYVKQAQKLGADVRAREEVKDWKVLPTGKVTVTTNKEQYTCSNIIFTAGSWSSHIVNCLAQKDLLKVERQVTAWFQPQKPELFTEEKFPVFNLLLNEGHYYGFPLMEDQLGVKFGKLGHFNEYLQHPKQLQESLPRLDDEKLIKEFVDRNVPQASGPTMRLENCMFTLTPDHNFIIDNHPLYKQVLIAAGFSGHGFKFASVIGELLAEKMEEKKSKFDLKMFELSRFK